MVRKLVRRLLPVSAARQVRLAASRSVVDRLEPRMLFAGDVVISELMAVNIKTRADEDGEFSDWIEIHNRGTGPVNLEGWHLTDARANPRKWTFPAVTLGAEEHLLVWASEKDRTNPNLPLHTNFKLASDGEYLALVMPDLTVSHAYDPFPEQKPDLSYGIGAPVVQTLPLVPAPASATYQFPTANPVGTAWTQRDFDDAGWLSGQTGLGYEETTGVQRPLPVEIEPNDSAVAATGSANEASANFGPLDDGLFQFTARGNIAVGESDYFALGPMETGDRVTLALAGFSGARGSLSDPIVELYRLGSPQPVFSNDDDGAGKDALIYRFRLPANDSYFVRARSVSAGMSGQYELGATLENAPGTPTPSPASAAVVVESEPNGDLASADDASASWRPVRHRSVTAAALDSNTDVDFYRVALKAGDTITVNADSTSAADLKLSLLHTNGSSLMAYDDGSAVPAAPFGADERDARVTAFTVISAGTYYVRVQANNALAGSYRLEINLSAAVAPPAAAWFAGMTATNVESQMRNKHSTVLVRVPFQVTEEDLAVLERLTLSMRYDDGFVAYLNGTEVARRNAPGAAGTAVAFDAVATADRPNDQSVAATQIDLTPVRNLLVAGENVLAVHALNASAGDDDFLIRPELLELTGLMEIDPGFFSRPTPGAGNPVVDSLGIVADTRFDHDRGFYDAPFDLVITTATPGAQIRYTTNGVPPTANTGTLYTGPVRVDRTTTVRAAAFKPGYVSSNVDTQTFLFLNDVIRQSPNGAPPPGWPGGWGGNVVDYGMDPDVVNNVAYRDTIKNDLKTIPTFSIVMKLDDMFGSAGIYSNPRMDGREWERPASLELIYPDGTRGFQSDVGLRVRGGFSRSTDNPKHGLRVLYRAEYGDADLDFPLFGPDGASSLDGFDLRTFNNYSWSFGGAANGLFMRDMVNRDLQLAMGQPAERGDYYHLYINGQYWGIYNSTERPEANYAATYFGGKEEDYDVIKADNDAGNQVKATDGNLTAWTQLYDLLKNGATVTDAVYQRVMGNSPSGVADPTLPVLLDVDNLIDYNLVIFYGGNLDSPVSAFINQNAGINNFYASRNRTLEARQGFRFFVHDAEHTLLNVDEDRTGPFPSGATVATSNPHYFFQRLSTNPEFRLRVADRVQKHFANGGVLTPQSVRELFMRRKEQLDRAVVAESARWGDSKVASPRTRNVDWLNEVQRILTSYIPFRSGKVLDQLRADGLWPAVVAPTFGKFGGTVAPGYRLAITRPLTPAATIYYTLDGSDPRLPGGGVSPFAVAYTGPVALDAPATVRARVLQNNVWSAMTEAPFAIDSVPLRVTEVMYHPAPPEPGSPFNVDDFEFIEVRNVGAAALDLSGVNFDKGITFSFAEGTTLAPGAYAVVVRNAAAFASRYGDGVVPAGVFTGGLNDAGERVRLLAAPWDGGHTLIDFTYSDAWQPRTDGAGYSLVPRDPAAAPEAWEDPARWRHSRAAGGTPGAADPGPAEGVVGRWAFYNRTGFDGTVSFADSSDDNAMDRNKRALLPGERSSGVNYTTHSRGITGLFVDMTNLAHGAVLTAADFVFRAGTSANPATWSFAPGPTSVAVRRGAGVGGSDRVTLVWPDNAIRNKWLQVTVAANARTGLAAPDVFYFGHLAYDSGDTPVGAAAAVIDVRDEAAVRRRVSRNFVNAGSPFDFNKDGVVTAADAMLTRRAVRSTLPMFTAPGGVRAASFSDQFVPPPAPATRSAPARRTSLLADDAGAILGA